MIFLQYGQRRINTSMIKEYKPVLDDKTDNHDIVLVFIDGTVEVLHFFDKKDKRDTFLGLLDQNLLHTTE